MNDSKQAAARYFLTRPCTCPDSPVEHEVSKADYVSAEREVGFYNTLGRPKEPATGSFSSTKSGVTISGRISNESLLDQP